MRVKSLLLFAIISIVSLTILVACGTDDAVNQYSHLETQATKHCADVSGDYTGVKVEDGDGVTITTISVVDTSTGEHIDVTITIDGITVTLEPVNPSLALVDASWCIKAANLASNGTGSEDISTPHTKTNKKGKANTPDVSYFMLYSVSTQEIVSALVASNDSFTVSESETTGDVDVNVISNDIGSNLIVLDVTALSPDIGSFTFTSDGDIDFDAQGEFENLAAGEELVLSFTYTVSDGTNQTTATVEIIVVGENDAPEAMNDDFSTDADTLVALPILANDSDIDGDTLSITAVTALTPDQGTLILNPDGSYSYYPMGAFSDLLVGQTEEVMFTYTVSDGTVAVDADVTITITGTKENLCVDNLPAITRSYTLETQDDVISMRADFMDADGNLTHNMLDGNLRLSPTGTELDLSPLDFLAKINDSFILDGNLTMVALDGSGLECLSEIGGTVRFRRTLLESISGFPALTTVSGPFSIDNNSQLTDISGFPLLQTVGDTFIIQDNDALPSISGFDALETVGAFIIYRNMDALQSVSGFSNLRTVTNGNFGFQFNQALTSISGFDALETVANHFITDSNFALQSISDFSMLETVGGRFLFGSNKVLTNLPAFPALTIVNGEFQIEFNDMLTGISQFTTLRMVGGHFVIRGNSVLESIPNFLALETIGGDFSVTSNPNLTGITTFPVLGLLSGTVTTIVGNGTGGWITDPDPLPTTP